MSVANEVFFYWPSLGRFSRRIRKTTRGQKKIWIVIVRYLKVIPFCTGRIKRGNFGPFVVLILLTPISIILSGWKNVFLEIRLSPIAQDEAEIVHLMSFCDETRTVTPAPPPAPFPSHHHLFICVFYSFWLHKKYMLRRKKLDGRNYNF